VKPDPNSKRPLATIRLEAVLITDRLMERPARTPDYEKEASILGGITRVLSGKPETILNLLAAVAADLCPGGSGGISLIEQDGSKECFRWVALAGALHPYVGGCAPRDISPCAVTLEKGTPQLFLRPGRFFPDFAGVEPAIIEGLVIPFVPAERPWGTIWVVSHSPDRVFDREDVRILTNLAAFAACAYQMRLIGEGMQTMERSARATSERLARLSAEKPDAESASNSHFLRQAAQLVASQADRLRAGLNGR
jgi:GAF domain-containing protein